MSKPRPLQGQRVVLTRAKATGSEWQKYLTRVGAKVEIFPCIETKPILPTKKLERVLSKLDSFDWLVFTSAAGPRALSQLMAKSSALQNNRLPQIAAIGEPTARAVHAAGWRVRLIPEKSDSRTLAREIPAGSKVLLLRGDLASDELPKNLRRRGVKVTDAKIYQTKILKQNPGTNFRSMLLHQRIDYLIFASPSAVRGFVARLKKRLMVNGRMIPVIALGAEVAKELRKNGFRRIRTAKAPTIEAIANAIPNT